jgi:hypothetical protein
MTDRFSGEKSILFFEKNGRFVAKLNCYRFLLWNLEIEFSIKNRKKWSISQKIVLSWQNRLIFDFLTKFQILDFRPVLSIFTVFTKLVHSDFHHHIDFSIPMPGDETSGSIFCKNIRKISSCLKIVTIECIFCMDIYFAIRQKKGAIRFLASCYCLPACLPPCLTTQVVQSGCSQLVPRSEMSSTRSK